MSTRDKILAAIVVIFFVCLVTWAVRNAPPAPPPVEKIEPPTVMEYEGNTLVEERDGVIIWELTCEKMRIDSVTQNIELDGVTCKFFQQDEEKSWQLTAQKGIYYQTFKVIHVEGDVVVVNSDGAKLTSGQLDWFGEQEMVVATGEVKISKDDLRAFGDMAYSNNGFKHFGLWGNAKLMKGVIDEPTN